MKNAHYIQSIQTIIGIYQHVTQTVLASQYFITVLLLSLHVLLFIMSAMMIFQYDLCKPPTGHYKKLKKIYDLTYY